MEIKKGGFYLRTGESTKSWTKGKVYKSPKDGYLINDKGIESLLLYSNFTNKIAVHVPTQEDWDFVIGKVRDRYYNCFSRYGKDTSIYLSDGGYCTKGYFQKNKYHIITIDQFRALFEEEVNKKVYIRGHVTRGAEVIAKLESLGGDNIQLWGGHIETSFYVIRTDGKVIRQEFSEPEGCAEIFLDEPVNDDQHITELKSDKTDSIGYKQSENKLSYELDWNFITQMAERMDSNKGKYKPYNWQKPIDTQDLRNAITRHAIEVAKGNFADDGRPFGHLEALACNSMMLNFQLQNKK